MADEKKMTEDDLRKLVDSDFETAMGKGEIATERAKAWDYYLSHPRGDEVDGESQIVTSDVSDVIGGIMPSLLRLFTTADNLVSFDPVEPNDIEAAEQESDYVNYVFFKQNPAFMLLYTWMFDALLQKNGVVKCWWDESERVTTESYEGLTEPELLELMSDEELEAIEKEEYDEVTVDPTTSQPVIAKLTNVKFRRVSKRGQVRIEDVPPEEYRITSDAKNLDPCTARMVGQECEKTRSELVEMGFDKELVWSLPCSDEKTSSAEGAARNDKSDENASDTGDSRDKSQEKVLLREGYRKVDFDGDGRSELIQVFTAGGKLLSQEDADRQPFHVISPEPLPHKHFGRATAEKVMDIQDINTTLTRQSVTNLYHVNNPGHAVWEQGMGENTLDDLLTNRIGSVKRFARPVGESYQPLTVPFTAGASFEVMQWFDKVKRDRTGIASDSEGLSPEALKNIQQTVLASSVDLSKMKIEAIARIFAETGIKSLFLHIHELIQKHQQKPTVARLRNKFVQVNPQQWRTRMDMTVNIGLGIGTREQNLLHLNAIWEKQEKMIAGGWGGLTVTPQNVFRTAAEMVKNANLKDPEMFFKDPGQQVGPPPHPEQLKLQQQEQQLIAQQQALDAEKRRQDAQKQQLDQQEMMLKHQREVMEIQRKAEADKDKYQIENEKLRNELLEIRLQAGKPEARA